MVVGTGALVYRRAIEDAVGERELGSVERAHPSAAAMAELAVPRFLREEDDRLTDIEPIYLRKTDAELNFERRIGAAPSRSKGKRGA